MQVTTKLQGPFGYSSIYVAIPILIALATAAYFAYLKYQEYMKKKKEEEYQEALLHPKPLTAFRIAEIKNRYLEELDKIEKQEDIRKAYQDLSALIRNFVSEISRKNVTNLTLKEIDKKEMPALYNLIAEYYKPEFSENSISNIKESIINTRKVIEEWN